MASVGDKDHGVRARDGVDRVTSRVDVVEYAGVDVGAQPRAHRGPAHHDGQRVEYVAKCRIRNRIISRRERDARLRRAEMVVRVIEPRNHHPPAYIDALRVRVGESEDL